MAEATRVADKAAPSRMPRDDKDTLYREITGQIDAVLAGEDDLLAAMATMVCLLHNAFPYFFWTGFYRRVGPAALKVGPYQGTMGCIDIAFGRGVCGAAAAERRTQLVDDVNVFPGHIACDSASASEIVVPVFDAANEVIAVLDVDSTIPAAFDDVDQHHLEAIVARLRTCRAAPAVTA